MAGKRPIRADDLYNISNITGVRLSPDGKSVLFNSSRTDKVTQKKYMNLWIAPTKGGQPKQFTYGDQVDALAEFSPDGTKIAFISNRQNEAQFQIHIIDVDGGEARPITNLKGQFAQLAWSPDGKRIAIVFRKKDKEVMDREADEQAKKLGVVCRNYDRIFYKQEAKGYMPHERFHIWIVNAKTGKAKQITDHKVRDEHSVSWSPDGKRLVYLTNTSKDPDLDLENMDIYTMSVDGGKPKKIPTPYGSKELPTYSNDGKTIAYYGAEGKGVWWKNTTVWIVPANGKGKSVDLTKRADITCSQGTLNDIIGTPVLTRPIWSPDDNVIYFSASEHGNITLRCVGVQDKKHKVMDVIDDVGVLGEFSFDKAHSRVAYFHADGYNPGEVWTMDMASGKKKQLTKINQKALSKINLGKLESDWFKGPGGEKIQYWILKPPGFSARKKYPAIIQIHGGPMAQYGTNFMHEFYYLAAQGYVVAFCNPRGSIGYGNAFCKAIWNDWGNKDYADLMKFADLVAKQKYVDKDKMGVAGGSYGGYMSCWIVGSTNRFKAAVAMRLVSNLMTLSGTSDLNWVFNLEFGEKPVWENMRNFWKQSPLRLVGNVKTPTMVIHSEKDFRCCVEQGEQYYAALKQVGVDTELVLFPDESHELSRGGRMDRRVARLGHIGRWFDKYLK